jgi:hypothetical protein
MKLELVNVGRQAAHQTDRTYKQLVLGVYLDALVHHAQWKRKTLLDPASEVFLVV